MASWYDEIPVSVNDTYGDPLIIEQVDDTLDKVERLTGHSAPIAMFTKAPYDARVIPKLTRLAQNRMLIPFYSLTGLNEGGIDPSSRRRMIDAMAQAFGWVVILTRPIIRGKNDDRETLQSIVKVASETGSLLVLGGVHSSTKRKLLKEDSETLLRDLCDDFSVRSFFKSSCLAAYINGRPCSTHDLQATPKNLDVVDELGYEYALTENGIRLPAGTTGDLNFLRILTNSTVSTQKILNNYNILSLETTPGVEYECTSSWFCWARNIDTCIGCSYCIILQIEYLQKQLKPIGTHPSEILHHLQSKHVKQEFSFSKTKLSNVGQQEEVFYDDVRTVKPCCAHAYEPFKRSN